MTTASPLELPNATLEGDTPARLGGRGAKHGADGDFGSETVLWGGKFQEAFGLESGRVGGVTAALLATHSRTSR